MAEIKVGMLVEITAVSVPWNSKFIGHRGIVLRQYGISPVSGDILYDIEGASPETHAFPSRFLRPIPDDSAFQTFMGEVFKHVDIGVKSGETV